MRNNLFDSNIGMLFSGIIIKQTFQIIDKIIFLVRDLNIGHYNVVRAVEPCVLLRIVDAVGFAGKVYSLDDVLGILLD